MTEDYDLIIQKKHRTVTPMNLLNYLIKKYSANYVGIKRNGSFMYLQSDFNEGDKIKLCFPSEKGLIPYGLNHILASVVHVAINRIFCGFVASNTQVATHLLILDFDSSEDGFVLKLKGHIANGLDLSKIEALITFMVDAIILKCSKKNLAFIEFNVESKIQEQLKNCIGTFNHEKFMQEMFNCTPYYDKLILEHYGGLDIESFDLEHPTEENPCFIKEIKSPCTICQIKDMHSVVMTIKAKAIVNDVVCARANIVCKKEEILNSFDFC